MSETFKDKDILALPGRVLIHCAKSQEVKMQLESALILQELVKEKIATIKKHLENIQLQSMTGKNLTDSELTRDQFIAMADLELKLRDELKMFESLVEESEK